MYQSAMIGTAAFAVSLLLTPVQYATPYANGATIQGDACQGRLLSPPVEVSAERKDPTFSYSESTAQLSQKSAQGGSYRPPGATGPAWHTGGLTQGMFTYKRNIPYQLISVSNGMNCLSITQIKFDIILTPQVWVANDYAPGTCMYNAVHQHEMKHVNVDRIVTDRHLPQIRAALNQFSQNRGFFGPGTRDQIKAQFDQFTTQMGNVLQDELDSMSREDAREQQNVDTLQEYQRINNLCKAQLQEMAR